MAQTWDIKTLRVEACSEWPLEGPCEHRIVVYLNGDHMFTRKYEDRIAMAADHAIVMADLLAVVARLSPDKGIR